MKAFLILFFFNFYLFAELSKNREYEIQAIGNFQIFSKKLDLEKKENCTEDFYNNLFIFKNTPLNKRPELYSIEEAEEILYLNKLCSTENPMMLEFSNKHKVRYIDFFDNGLFPLCFNKESICILNNSNYYVKNNNIEIQNHFIELKIKPTNKYFGIEESFIFDKTDSIKNINLKISNIIK